MNDVIDLNKINKVHFIGIGGIGISAIARMMLYEGKIVIGSDLVASLITEELVEAGAKIHLGQSLDFIEPDTSLIVYTIAITEYDPKLFEALKKLTIPSLSYPEMLGLVSAQKYTIAVAGTHGKTTTTAMLAKIFVEAELNPTVIVGSLLKDLKTNFIAGRGKYFITEACEYRRSFLNLNPQAAIITNIDNDHLDYYKDLPDIQSAFAELSAKIPADGFLVCNTNDPALAPVLLAAKCRILDYTKHPWSVELRLIVPGQHNVKNAMAALVLTDALKVPKNRVITALSRFTGTWRRFEFKGLTADKVMIYDDYAHHPTEIKATLEGAREWAGNKKIIVAFQPHLYSRTKLLLNDFAASFGDADIVIMPDIYAAREMDDGTISSRDVIDLLNKQNKEAYYAPTFPEVEKIIKEKAVAGDMIITMGAGDIFKVAEKLTSPF